MINSQLIKFGTILLLLCGGLTASILLTGCGKPRNPSVVARVGSREITTEDFADEMRWYAENERKLPAREVLLERMVSRELAAQKARSLGLHNDPNVRRAFDLLLMEKLRESGLKPRTTEEVSPAELNAFYEQNIQQYTRPGKTRLAIVWVKVDQKASTEKRQEARARIVEARRRAESLIPLTNGFGPVALEFSDDQISRYKGGDAGWFDETMPESRLPKAVVSAASALPRNGELSEVIDAEGGFYIVTRLDTREQSVIPLEQVRDSVRRQIVSRKMREAEEVFNRELHAFTRVETNLQALNQIQYPATTDPATHGQPPALPRSQ